MTDPVGNYVTGDTPASRPTYAGGRGPRRAGRYRQYELATHRAVQPPSRAGVGRIGRPNG